MMAQTQQRLADALGDLVDGPVAVDLRKPVAMLAIVLDHRKGLLVERAHALMKDLDRVVGTLDECSPIVVADAVVLRRLRVDVVDRAIDRAREPTGDALEDRKSVV